MLPIGTNINMNGTALYEVVAAVFIAELNHINLDFSQLITLCLTAAVSSIGAAGIPAAGAVTTLFVLMAIGLPAKQASILVVVEWLLDRCNTVINIMGDCIAVALINHVLKKDLEEMGEEEQEMTRYTVCLTPLTGCMVATLRAAPWTRSTPRPAGRTLMMKPFTCSQKLHHPETQIQSTTPARNRRNLEMPQKNICHGDDEYL